MSGPVDVLAALDVAIARNIERGAAKGSPSDRDLRKVRKEVVALIKASNAMLLALYEERSPSTEYADLQNAVNAMGKYHD